MVAGVSQHSYITLELSFDKIIPLTLIGLFVMVWLIHLFYREQRVGTR